jgi:trans-aconitate methyltransferase
MLLLKITRALKPGGTLLAQMGGKGNAASIIEVIYQVIDRAAWHAYFDGFAFPYSFNGVDEYKAWLVDAGLHPIRVELLLKDMVQPGKGGLAGWIRTTWLPYTERVPDQLRGKFIDALVDEYIDRHPLDAEGKVHVPMVRLEVEAVKDG